MTMQSHNSLGIAINTKSDVYSVTFTRSDSGGSQIFSTTAIYQSAGLYKASLTPTIAGIYTVTVQMTNAYSLPTEIVGSPFTVYVDSDHKLNSIETF